MHARACVRAHLHSHTCPFRKEKAHQQRLRDKSQMEGQRQSLPPGTQGWEGRAWQSPRDSWLALESKLDWRWVPYIFRNCEEVPIFPDFSTWQGLI